MHRRADADLTPTISPSSGLLARAQRTFVCTPTTSRRDLHLVKKALAIATLAIERQPGPFQSTSDHADMKDLFDRMIELDVELEHYARAARIAVIGEPD